MIIADTFGHSSVLVPTANPSLGNRLSEADRRRLRQQNSRLSETEQQRLYGNPFARTAQPATVGTSSPSRQPRTRTVPAAARALAVMLRALSTSA